MERKLKCPACGDDMKEILIKDRNIKIDICLDGCGGIYFDNRELEQFRDNKKDINEVLEFLKGKNFKQVPDNDRICPVCKTKMVKNFASPKEVISIDQCYNCGGIFLDNEELSKIRKEYNNANELSADVKKMIASKVGKELEESRLFEKKANNIHSLLDLLKAII